LARTVLAMPEPSPDPSAARAFAHTTAAQAGLARELGAPSAPPIVAASHFLAQGDPAEFPYGYARNATPAWEALETALGALERAHARVFASGQAASFALLAALNQPQRRQLLLASGGYYGTRKLADLLASLGCAHAVLDFDDVPALERALAAQPSILWVESPTNPLLRVHDLAALAQLARAAGAPFVVDNTVATAALQQPLELGASASLCSLTKSAAGHADLVAGSIATRDTELLARIDAWRSSAGAIASPFDAWLALRGLRTLPLRIERQSASAAELARRLAAHPRVARVHYPGLDERTRALAARQMPRGAGPLLSFELRASERSDADARAADAVVAAARLVLPSTSFGGYASSWERRARWPSERAPAGLIRLSVGLEEVSDLWDDIERALRA